MGVKRAGATSCFLSSVEIPGKVCPYAWIRKKERGIWVLQHETEKK